MFKFILLGSALAHGLLGVVLYLWVIGPNGSRAGLDPGISVRLQAPNIVASESSPSGNVSEKPVQDPPAVEDISLSRPAPQPSEKSEAPSEKGRKQGDVFIEAAPVVGKNPTPNYPETARKFGWEGTAVLTVEVLEDGTVGTVVVATSSGYSILDETAVEAVRRWEFKPARWGSRTIESKVSLTFVFKLTEEKR